MNNPRLEGNPSSSSRSLATRRERQNLGGLWRLSRCPQRVHPISHFVEAIAVEMAVQIERHRRAGMPVHLLHDLHVGPAGDGEGRCGVPQAVRRQPVRAGLAHRGIEDRRAEVGQPEQTALGRGERRSPPAPCLRSTAPDRRRGRSRRGGASGRGDARAARTAREADAGVGEEQDGRPIVAGGVGQLIYLAANMTEPSNPVPRGTWALNRESAGNPADDTFNP